MNSFQKNFKSEVKSESDIKNILKNYENLNIAVRHSDTFLKDESSAKHDGIIKLLEKYGKVKQTWRKNKQLNSKTSIHN